MILKKIKKSLGFIAATTFVLSAQADNQRLSLVAEEGISFAEMAKFVLTENETALEKIQELAALSTSDTNTQEDRDALQQEVQEQIAIIESNGKSSFLDEPVFSGQFTHLDIYTTLQTPRPIEFNLEDMSPYGLGPQPGYAQTTGLRVSTLNDSADIGTQGIQEGEMNTIITQGDVVLYLAGETLYDFFGGDYWLTAQPGENALAAQNLAERFNKSRLEGEGAVTQLYATASTSFRTADMHANDYAGTRVPSPASRSVAAGSLSFGQLMINDVDIPAVTFMANDADGALVESINRVSYLSGVTASVDYDGELILYAEDGIDIILSADQAAVNSLFGAGGDGFDAGFANLRITGNITLSSKQGIVFGGANITDIGFNGNIGGANIQPTGNIGGVDVTTISNAYSAIDTTQKALQQVRDYKFKALELKLKLQAILQQ